MIRAPCGFPVPRTGAAWNSHLHQGLGVGVGTRRWEWGEPRKGMWRTQRKRWGPPRRGRQERGGAGAGPGAGLRGGGAPQRPLAARSPPCPGAAGGWGSAAPLCATRCPGGERLRHSGVSAESRRPGPVPAALSSSFSAPPSSGPRPPDPSCSHWAASSSASCRAPYPARPGAFTPPHSLPVPLFIPPPIPGLQGGENKLKAEQLRDSNKTPGT